MPPPEEDVVNRAAKCIADVVKKPAILVKDELALALRWGDLHAIGRALRVLGLVEGVLFEVKLHQVDARFGRVGLQPQRFVIDGDGLRSLRNHGCSVFQLTVMGDQDKL